MSEKATARDQRLALSGCIVIALLLVGVTVGAWVYSSLRQKWAVEELRSIKGSRILYAYELDDDLESVDDPAPGPEWLRDWLGIDFLTHVSGVYINYPDDPSILAFPDFPALRALCIFDPPKSGERATLEPLVKVTQLEKLSLLYLNAGDNALAILPALPRLRTLRLLRCNELTDGAFDHIARIGSLTRFDLWQCQNLTNRGVAKLAQLPKLTTLHIEFTKRLTDDVLRQLQSAPRLQNLELRYADTLSVDGLKYLGGFTALEQLEIVNAHHLVDADLLQIPRLPALERFVLNSALRITADGLACLGQMPNLKELGLIGPVASDITDAMLAPIGRLQRLTSLHLDCCDHLTGAGLAALATFERLETLDFVLHDRKRTLDAEALDALRKRLPKCRIQIHYSKAIVL